MTDKRDIIEKLVTNHPDVYDNKYWDRTEGKGRFLYIKFHDDYMAMLQRILEANEKESLLTQYSTLKFLTELRDHHGYDDTPIVDLLIEEWESIL